MKISKKLKLALIILICVLIILIGFFGIYKKKGNQYKNILPEYSFAPDIIGTTVLELKVDDSKETKYYDKDGKEVNSSDVTEKNEKDYKKEEIPVNAEENLTKENYKKVVDIMEKRLKFLRADQYRIDLDNKTGNVAVSYKDDYPDDIKSFLPMEAKLELIDSKTEDVILTYTDFEKVEASYASLLQGYNVYLTLKLNESGLEKINNIEKYKTVEAVKEETESNEEEKKANTFKIMFDVEQIAEVSYDDISITNKTLRITTAKDLTSDSEINSQLNVNIIVSELANIGKLPIVYENSLEEEIKSERINFIPYVIGTISVISALCLIYFIIRYKVNGLLAFIGVITNVSLFLLLIRLTNIEISLNGLAGIVGLILLNIILINNILKHIKDEEKVFSENVKRAYINTIDVFAIILILFVVFAFSSMTIINSAGLLLFWGWIVTILGTLIFTVSMLSIANNK